ncbi:IS66 family transposase [Ureibacillus massiliensis]|uniref:IS66 family transposase n=1 Tax=Ureibacillus massiliensis TaxID=292806 RepID=UPI001F19EB45|nr:IS66 family transposase [Ureibacillus massiliensis]
MNDLTNVNQKQEEQNERIIRLLEQQLAQSNRQIEALTEQVRQLTKALYGSKSEKSKYQAPDGQVSLFEDDPSFSDSEQTEKQSTGTVSYTVIRKKTNKKRNDSFRDGIEVEEIHHYPSNTQCDCCSGEMAEVGSTVVREEAKFIPATMKRVQHIEHAYECKVCKKDVTQKAQIKRGKAPQATIQRSIAGPTILAKLIYDKFIQYLPLYRQVKEWERYGLLTNDKNLSNWVIRAAEDWLLPVYKQMKNVLMEKSVLHVDETYAQIIKRSDGKSGQSNAYNWVCRSVPSQGPIIVLFKSALSRSRAVLEDLISGFKGTVICDGYSAYGHLPNIEFANCWAHVRRYWLKADSKNGQIGVDYCDQLFHIERKIKPLSPEERLEVRQQESKPIVDEFFAWIDSSPFFGKNALAKAAEYTLSRATGLKAFLDNGHLEIDNNPAENAIRPNVIGRKNWLFSVSEAGANANAICLSLAETAKANGIDFYQYLVKLMTELPTLPIHQQPELLHNYMPWSKNIQGTCAK